MGFLTDLSEGAAGALAAAGVGVWTPSGPIPTGGDLPPILIGTSPATPDVTLVLTPYGVDDTADEHGTYGLQVRTRGTRNPNVAYDLDDAVFGVLHAPRGLVLGGITVAQCLRRSGPMPLGTDSNGRAELTSNYYLVVGRESAGPWS